MPFKRKLSDKKFQKIHTMEESYFSILENSYRVYNENYDLAINSITTEICYQKKDSFYQYCDEGFAPFYAKILSTDFLLKHAENAAMWNRCPNLYNKEIFDIIKKLQTEDKFPYNSDILNIFKQIYNLKSECVFINAVIYCTQRFARFVIAEQTGRAFRDKYPDYEQVTKEFLVKNINKKILIAGRDDYYLISQNPRKEYIFFKKGARKYGFRFDGTELVKIFD